MVIIMKFAIIYYSLGGNTRRIANMIKDKISADIFEIETKTPYTGTYNQIVNQGQDEVDSGFCPEIKKLNIDLSKYDTVFLGSPVWWYTFAPAMHSFLNKYDLSGKKIFPFATNGGWLGHTLKDFSSMCFGANVEKGIDIRFDESIHNGHQDKAYPKSLKLNLALF